MKNATVRTRFRRLLSLMLCVCLLAGIVGMSGVGVIRAEAAELQDAANLSLAPKTTEAVTVDGELSEEIWTAADAQYIEFLADFTISNNVSTFKTAWDAENLYIAVEVQDAAVVTAENGVLGENIYDNDSIEIFIDGDNGKSYSYDKLNDFHIYIQHDGKIQAQGGTAGTWGDCLAQLEGMEYKVVMTEAGFNLELALPFAAIGATPGDGTCIGLNVVNNDNDNYAGGGRKEIIWNPAHLYNRPQTWGAVCLYETRRPVVSTYGTPKLGSNKLTNWDPAIWNFSDSYSLNFANAEGATLKFASLSDYEGLYIALLAEGLGDVNPFAEVALSGTNVRGDGGRVEFDHIMQWNPGASEIWQKMNITSKLPSGVAKSSVSDKYDLGNGSYAVVVKFPWDQLGTIEDPEAPRANYSVMSFGIETGNDGAVAEGENTEWVKSFNAWWNPFRNVATLLINNPNIVEMNPNVAPTGNPLFAYSIPQGGSVSGNVNVTDANEGDVLTYALEAGYDAEKYGEVTVDSATGEWTYTTPNADFVQENRSGVNFWIITTDAAGESFRTRIQVNVEPTPTNLTYYVDGDTGSDSNDGLSLATALKTINAANAKVKPGDTVLVYSSDVPYGWYGLEEYEADPNLYGTVRNGAIHLTTSGLPEAPITYKAAPGEHPVIMANGVWQNVQISGNYIVMEGFHIHGQAYNLEYEDAFATFWAKIAPKDGDEYSSDWQYAVGLYNTNGLDVGPDSDISDVTDANANVTHHVTVRNCVVEAMPSAGIGGNQCDYVTFENITSINNGWWDMWGSSGIGFIKTIEIDDNDTDYKIIIRDCISAGNRHFIPWKANTVRLSDGNGIIFDTMDDHEFGYTGKCLVANNLVYENGGSGIHTFRSDNIDFVNNTVFNNGSTPELGWSELFANDAENINMYNNLVYSRTGNKEDIKSSSVKNVVYDNNLFFNYATGSNVGTTQSGVTVGENNIYGEDPLFTSAVSLNRWNDNKPEGFDTETGYPEAWYEAKTADSSITPNSWSVAANAKAAGWYPEVDYDVTKHAYDFTLAANSPAYDTADAQWQAIAGGAEYDNVIGIFGEVGAQLSDYDPEVPDPEKPDPEDPEPVESTVIRLSGKNRYDTAFAVANQLKSNLKLEQFEAVVVAYGQNFPDALTGSYLAAVKDAPILLTEKSADARVLDYIQTNLVPGGTVYILGGTAAVTQEFEDGANERGFTVKRLKDKNRYGTNLKILEEAGVNQTDEILIATGTNYADSLSASATGLPMLLVGGSLTEDQIAFLKNTSGKFVIIGGTGAVPQKVEDQLNEIGTAERVKGKTRYETSVVIAERYFGSPRAAVLAYAQGFPDGLCGGPLAMYMGAPLILTSNEFSAAADAYIEGITVGAVTGGTGRITDDTVRAIFDLAEDTEIPVQ